MRYIVAVVLILLISLSLKLINLTGQPLYLDEGLYIYWASLFATSPANAYLSLLDGKTPLFMWLVSWVNQYFSDYLYTARLTSVIGGVISAFCWSQIVRIISDRKTSLVFLFLIALTPYTYLVERMAFVDSTMTALASIGLLLSFLTIQFFYSSQYWWLGFITSILGGIVLGMSYMTKTSAKMFAYLTIGTVVYFAIISLAKNKLVFVLTIISAILIYLSYDQMIGFIKVGGYRYWSGIQTKETQLSYSIPEVISNIQIDRGHYLYHFNYLLDYLYTYLGVFIVIAIYGVFIILQSNRKNIWLVLYTIVITGGIFLSAKAIASRYFYPVTFPLIALSSIGLVHLWGSANRILKQSLIFVSLLLWIPVLLLIFSPLNAYYSFDDQSYFSSGDITALGLQDVELVLSQKPKDTVVGVYGIWGISEGVQTILQERGVEAIILGEWITQYSRNELSSCPSDQKLIGEFCYKLTILKIQNSRKANKYLYLTRENPQQSVALLQQLIDIQIVKTFIHPYSDSRVYLIKIL